MSTASGSSPTDRPLVGVPSVVRWITVLFVLLLLLGSVLYPLFEVPDEPFHADMVVAAMEGDGWPGLKERKVGPAIAGASRILRKGRHLEKDAIPRAERPTLAELRERPIEGRINRMTQHPPLYYVVVGVVTRTASSLLPPLYDLAFDQRLWLHRLVSVILLIPIPIISYQLVRSVTDDDSAAVVASVFPLAIPTLTLRNGPMINNDNLLVLLVSILLLLAVRVALGDDRSRTALAVGVVTGLALLTKGLALVLPGFVVGAYVVGAWRNGQRSVRRWVVACTTFLGSALTVGGWWWVRNLALYGDLQPGGVTGVPPADASFEPDVLHWFATAISTSSRSFWGGHFVGPPPDSFLYWGLTGLFVVGLVAALGKRPPDRSLVVILLLPTVLFILGIYVNSLSHYLDADRIAGVHGRYLLPGLTGLAAVIGIGYARVPRGRRWLPAAAMSFVAFIQARSGYSYLRSEWGPDGSEGGSLASSWDALLAWAPQDELRLSLAVALTLVVALVVLVKTVRIGISRTDTQVAGG